MPRMNLGQGRSDVRATIVLSFALMIICCAGCKPAGGGSSTVLTSPDGRVSITAPAGWEKHTFKSDRPKSIGIRNKAQNGWGEILIESKSDLKDGLTLSGYADIVLKKVEVRKASENRTVSEPTSLTINGYPAMRYDIKATVQNTKFIYARTFVETPDFFVQVMLWTVPSDLAENQADFDSIAGSLKQIK
jgi:hypothetical protein